MPSAHPASTLVARTAIHTFMVFLRLMNLSESYAAAGPQASAWLGRQLGCVTGRHAGIVGIALGAVPVERGGIPVIQRQTFTQAAHQIRVGDERLAECHRVGLTFVQKPLRALRIMALVGNDGPAEQTLDVRQ